MSRKAAGRSLAKRPAARRLSRDVPSSSPQKPLASQRESPVKPSTQATMQPGADTIHKSGVPKRRRNRQQVPADKAVSDRRPPPKIQVDIDPAIPCGFVHDRYDVLIRGRIESSVAVEEVALLVDGEMIGRVQYGQPDRDAETSLPDGSKAMQYVFHINLPLPRTQAKRTWPCMVVVRTPDND